MFGGKQNFGGTFFEVLKMFGVKQHLRFKNCWGLKKYGVHNVWGQQIWGGKFFWWQIIWVIKYGGSKFLRLKNSFGGLFCFIWGGTGLLAYKLFQG